MTKAEDKIFIGNTKDFDNEPYNPLDIMIDVTAKELENYSKNEYLKIILDALKENWCMGIKDREENVRIGTVKIFIDDEGFLHLDFKNRFKINKL